MQMIQLIKTEEEYDKSLARIYELMQLGRARKSDESNELSELADVVEAYENEFYPIPPPNKAN